MRLSWNPFNLWLVAFLLPGIWPAYTQLHAQGKLTPPQEFLCRPAMPAEELYDLQSDPYEINNLAGSPNPDHQAALNRLRQVLEQWIEDSHDQGRTFESPEVVAANTEPAPAKTKDANTKNKRTP